MDLAEVRELTDNVRANPPIWAIFAHHSVPWGRRYRQHMTDGRLIVWVNRGEIAELPPAKIVAGMDGALTGVLGIPVYNF